MPAAVDEGSYALPLIINSYIPMNTALTQTRESITKPVGVYFITIFDFIAVGLVPLIAIIWLNRQAEVELPFASLILRVSLAVLAMAASIWAVAGDNPGRCLLLGLVTVSSVLMIMNSISFMISGEAVGTNVITAIGAGIRGLFWLGINWWYFNRRHVVAFYKQNNWR